MATNGVRTAEEQKVRDDDSAAVGISYAFVGVVIGLVSTIVSMLISGFMIGLVQSVTDKDACGDGLGLPLTIGLFVFGILVSLWVGGTLFRSRKFIGQNSNGPGVPISEKAYAGMLRKRFTVSSMVVYCVLAPFTWLYILACAYCAGN